MIKLTSFILGLFILLFSGTSLFFSYGIFKAVWTQDYFNILPAFLKKANGVETLSTFSTEPDMMTEDQKKLITSQLIRDYLVYRYTIFPDKNLMEKRLGLWWTGKNKGRSKPEASYFLWTIDSLDGDVWTHLTDPIAGYQAKAMKLIEEGKTQSVEIISPPYKSETSDFWEAVLKLYTYALDDTIETRFLRVRMEVDLADSLRGRSDMKYYPATLFRFQVKKLHEIYPGHQN